MRWLLTTLLGCLALLAGCSHETNHRRFGAHGSGAVPAEASKKKECFTEPGECGFPDPSYVDVGYEGNCGSLPTVENLVLDTPGTRVERKNIRGGVYIGAENVTLNEDCITAVGDGKPDGSYLVSVSFEGNKAMISHSTLRGENATTESVQNGITNDDGASNVVANHDYIYNVGDAIHNHMLVENSYLDVNAEVTGEHYEAVYCNNATMEVVHDVLLNPHEQTAAVFCNVNGGEGGAAENHLTVTKSLLAGGDYVIYPQGNATSVGTSTMTITDNHFARCIGKHIFEPVFGVTSCEGGPDAYGYWPLGGVFGVVAYMYCPPMSGQVWTGNVWDNNDEAKACE
jgi:hypothetical protein